MVIGRGWWAFGLAWVAAVGFAQGGVAGGGGFGGGVAQGGIQGPEGQGSSQQLFLSPGDRTEWEFDAKTDDGVLVTITSQVFDPAVAVVDEKGTKLAENDDIEPGNQMARLVFVAPKDGKYKVVVTNYKGTAGGAFSFETSAFTSYPISLSAPTPVPEGKQHAWARVTIDKPGDYIVAAQTRNREGLRFMDPAGGTGSDIKLYQQDQGYTRFRFTAKTKGAFFVRGESARSFHIRPVETLTTEVGKTAARKLGADQYDDWTFTGKKGDVLEVVLTSKGKEPQFTVDLERDPSRQVGPAHTIKVASNPSRWTLLMWQDGPMGVRVWAPRGEETDYELTVRTTGRPLLKTSELASKLDWYASDVWLFEGRPGDVLTFRVSSETFVPQMTVVAPDGRQLMAKAEGVPPVGLASLEIWEPGRHVVYVAGGGVGTYRLRHEVTEPKTLGIGDFAGEIKESPEVWRFRAGKGQDLAIRVTATTLRWDLVVTGPDGEVAGTASNASDLLRLKIEKEGDYTVAVKGLEGTSGKYRIKRIDLDK